MQLETEVTKSGNYNYVYIYSYIDHFEYQSVFSHLLIGCHLRPQIGQVVMEISSSAASWYLAWLHKEVGDLLLTKMAVTYQLKGLCLHAFLTEVSGVRRHGT